MGWPKNKKSYHGRPYFIKNDTYMSNIFSYFLTFILMFKGKIHIYKNVDWKEEEIRKEFTDEGKFENFLKRNPELTELWDFHWKPTRWPSLSMFDDFWEETKKLWNGDFLEEIEEDIAKVEKEMKSIFDRSRKLLGK